MGSRTSCRHRGHSRPRILKRWPSRTSKFAALTTIECSVLLLRGALFASHHTHASSSPPLPHNNTTACPLSSRPAKLEPLFNSLFLFVRLPAPKTKNFPSHPNPIARSRRRIACLALTTTLPATTTTHQSINPGTCLHAVHLAAALTTACSSHNCDLLRHCWWRQFDVLLE